MEMVKKIYILGMISLFLFVGLATAVSAVNIDGTVKDGEEPISATISVYGTRRYFTGQTFVTEYKILYWGSTNDEGNYFIPNVKPGKLYKIKCNSIEDDDTGTLETDNFLLTSSTTINFDYETGEAKSKIIQNPFFARFFSNLQFFFINL